MSKARYTLMLRIQSSIARMKLGTETPRMEVSSTRERLRLLPLRATRKPTGTPIRVASSRETRRSPALREKKVHTRPKAG